MALPLIDIEGHVTNHPRNFITLYDQFKYFAVIKSPDLRPWSKELENNSVFSVADWELWLRDNYSTNSPPHQLARDHPNPIMPCYARLSVYVKDGEGRLDYTFKKKFYFFWLSYPKFLDWLSRLQWCMLVDYRYLEISQYIWLIKPTSTILTSETSRVTIEEELHKENNSQGEVTARVLLSMFSYRVGRRLASL